MPLTHFSAKMSATFPSRRIAAKKIVRHDRHHDVEIEVPVRARPGDGGVRADDLSANHHDRLADDRVHLPRHDRAAGLRRRQLNFPDAAARTAAQKANIIRDFEKTDRDRFELAARFDHPILGALRFEMIFRFAKCDAGPLFEMAHHFGREIAMTIEPGADCGPAEREFLQGGDRLLRAPFPETHLLRVTAEFLAESHRSRVHQMGATDLDHVVELGRFRRKRGGKFFERGNETCA